LDHSTYTVIHVVSGNQVVFAYAVCEVVDCERYKLSRLDEMFGIRDTILTHIYAHHKERVSFAKPLVAGPTKISLYKKARRNHNKHIQECNMIGDIYKRITRSRK
jgi:hypothetical protein